jgi:hypothetical protein
MKLRFIANFTSVAALAAILPLGISSAHAVSATTVPVAGDTVVQPSQFQRVNWGEAKKRKLRRAYWLLEIADRDYEGHRVKAMEEVKKAGDIIGMDLHGDGYGGEKKPLSDERLHEAKTLLVEVAEETGGKEFEHLHTAIRELNHALEAH